MTVKEAKKEFEKIVAGRGWFEPCTRMEKLERLARKTNDPALLARIDSAYKDCQRKMGMAV